MDRRLLVLSPGAGACGSQFADLPESGDRLIDADGNPIPSTFLDLSDTPSSYAGSALKAVRLNAAGTDLEFYEGGGGGVFTPTDVKTANYSCSAMWEMVLCNDTGGSFQVTLPVIAGSSDIGKQVNVKRIVTVGQGVTIAGPGFVENQHQLLAGSTYGFHSQIYCVVTTTQWCIIADFWEPGFG